MQFMKDRNSNTKPYCPFCGEEHVLKGNRCHQCHALFEIVLVIGGFQASVRLLPRFYEIRKLSELICLLSAETIEIRNCPFCSEQMLFLPDANGMQMPYCEDKGLFFPPVLAESGEITLVCKPDDYPHALENELRSLSLSEYREEVAQIAPKLLSQGEIASQAVPEVCSVDTHEKSDDAAKHNGPKKMITAYLTLKGDSATVEELVESTGKSKYAVNKAIHQLLEEDRLVKVKRGLYDVPKRKLVKNVMDIIMRDSTP